MKKSVFKSFAIFAIIFLVFAGNASARAYKIGMIHWIAYSPLNAASSQEMWKKNGIDVQVINFGSNQELNSALENKRIDIALDMIGSWVGMHQDGVPLTIIGETDWSNGGDKIIAKKDADLKKLKGETIGVYLNKPSVSYFLNSYLAENGVKLSDVKLIELEPQAMTDNFIAGRFKVIVNYDPEALRAERAGNGKVAATSASYAGCIPEGFVSRTDVLESIPKEDLSKIFKAWIEAVKWTKNPANWNEYKQILNSKTFEGEPPYSDADLKSMLDSVSIHDSKTQLERNNTGGGLQTYLKNLKGFLSENNMLKKEFDPGKIFDNSTIVEVLKSNQ